jgi:hypothetical protein
LAATLAEATPHGDSLGKRKTQWVLSGPPLQVQVQWLRRTVQGKSKRAAGSLSPGWRIQQNDPESRDTEQPLKFDIRDLIAGLLMISVGLFVALYASNQYQVGSAARMGPGYFPTILGSILAVLGLVIALMSFREVVHILKPPPFTPRPFIAVIAAVALFALLIGRVGLVPTTILMVIVTASGSNSFQLPRAVLLGISLSVIAWLIFSLGLQMTLPAFAWEF